MKSLSIFLVALVLAGCGSNRPVAERQSFLIQTERVGAAVGPVAGSLRVVRAAVASPFDEREMVYRRNDVRFETDFYNKFAADPGDMLAAEMSSWLRQSGLFRQIVLPGAAATADYRLETRVSALYVDFQPEPPAAVITIRWQLVRESDGNIALDLDCWQRVGLAERSPDGAVRAYREALQQALGQLEAALVNASF